MPYGVERDAIVEDYALSADRVPLVIKRLASRRTYAEDIAVDDEQMHRHRPQPATMERLLAAIDDLYGGVPAWLRTHGWTEDDAAALRERLLD